MEKHPNFVLKLTLEEMALRRVVVNLWNECDISLPTNQNFRRGHLERAVLPISLNTRPKEEWRNLVEKRVKDKLSNLILPDSLKKRMMHLVTPIGYQILKWKITYEEFDENILEKLWWTSTGEVDYRKTAENVVRIETFDAAKRYELACSFCLDDYLSELWEKLTEERKKSYHLTNGNILGFKMPMKVYWAFVLRGWKFHFNSFKSWGSGRFESFSTISELVFLSSASEGNKAAAEYFFQQLTSEKQNSILVRVVDALIEKSRYFWIGPDAYPQENVSDVLRYLLTLMNPGQQMQVLQKHPYKVLRCFLEWPRQDLFLDILDLVRTILPESEYSNLIEKITVDIIRADSYFPNLIQKFLLISPGGFRKHFVRSLCSHFPEFFHDEDPETIEEFFKNVDLDCRARLLLDSGFLHHLGDLMMKEKWHLVEVFIREASLTRENKEELKEAFFKEFRPTSREGKKIRRKRRLTRFFQILG